MMPGESGGSLTLEGVVAVLQNELDNLDRRAEERHKAQMLKWVSHDEADKAQAARFNVVCERVAELEKWRAHHKGTAGAMARLSAVVSAGVLALSEFVRWLVNRVT